MAKDKIALITAGGSGMGAAAARRLAADGFKVGVLSSSGKGEALAKELGGIGVTGSNQSNADLGKLVDMAVAKWGRIDVLVNSGGHGPRAPILEISDEDWHRGHGHLPDERHPPDPAGDPGDAKAEIRRHHQYLDRLDLRAERHVPDIGGLSCRPRQLHQNLRRHLCGATISA